MSFSDWEFFAAFPSQQVYVDLTAPLVGSGSLRLVGSAAGPGGLYGRWGQATQHGFRQGRVSTLLQPLAGLPGQDWYGVYSAASVVNLTGTAGTAYAAALVVGASPTSWELQLLKVTAGLATVPTVLAAQFFSCAFDQIVGMQLQWLSTPETGVALSLSIGTALDYSDLVQVLLAQDPSVDIQASEGEGPIAVLTATGSCRFDQTATEEI